MEPGPVEPGPVEPVLLEPVVSPAPEPLPQPDLATSAAGQGTTLYCTLSLKNAGVSESCFLKDVAREERERRMRRKERGRSSPRIIGALHPSPTETAARLQCLGNFRAVVRLHAAVLLAPYCGSGLPLSGAGIEHTEAAAWHLQEKFHKSELLIIRSNQKLPAAGP